VSAGGPAVCDLPLPVLVLVAACMLLQAALPLRRTTYEGGWQQLEAWPAGKPIRYQDVPWPCPTPGSQAAARKQQQQQQQQEALDLDPQQLQTLVLAGMDSCGTGLCAQHGVWIMVQSSETYSTTSEEMHKCEMLHFMTQTL